MEFLVPIHELDCLNGYLAYVADKHLVWTPCVRVCKVLPPEACKFENILTRLLVYPSYCWQSFADLLDGFALG